MKYKATRKEIMQGYRRVYCVGYCNLQALLNYENPIAYTCGTYGWNADIYDVDGVAIVTGYRPFGKPIPYDTACEYERRAMNTQRDGVTWWQERDERGALLREMIDTLERGAE